MTIALTLFAPQPTRGCSCLRPAHWGFIGPEDGQLPANATGVLWYKPRQADESSVAARITVEKHVQDRFERVAGTARSVDGFPGIFLVAPRDGLTIGSTYRFTDRGSILDDGHPDWADDVRPLGSGPHRQIQVTVDPDRLTASSSLTIEAGATTTEPIRVASGGGACVVFGEPIPHVAIEAGLAPEAERWRGQLLFRTLVDEEPWAGADSLCSLYPSGRSWRQVGRDTVYSTCQEPDARGETPIAYRPPPGGRYRTLAATRHNVKMQAILPGSGIFLESETLAVDLSCPRSAREAWIDAAWFGLRPPESPCSCPADAFSASGFAGPAEARLPANAAGVIWYDSENWRSRPVQQQPDPADVLSSRLSVRMLNGQDWDAPLPTVVTAVPDFPGVFVVAPEGGFVAGARYFFVESEREDDWWRPGDDPWDLQAGVIATIDSQDLLRTDTTLTLNATPSVFETLRVARSFRCDAVERLPQVHIEARLDGMGHRWRDQFLYRTLVDGRRWRETSTTCTRVQLRPRTWADTGNDVLYSRCGEDPWHVYHGLDPGPHRVQMQAFLPGTDILLETETLTVDLSCPGPVEN